MNEANLRNERTDIDLEADDLEQFVTFIIGNEVYGVDVLKVQEIIGITDITHVPNSMSFMKGVINLRGNVVLVVGLKRRKIFPPNQHRKNEQHQHLHSLLYNEPIFQQHSLG